MNIIHPNIFWTHHFLLCTKCKQDPSLDQPMRGQCLYRVTNQRPANCQHWSQCIIRSIMGISDLSSDNVPYLGPSVVSVTQSTPRIMIIAYFRISHSIFRFDCNKSLSRIYIILLQLWLEPWQTNMNCAGGNNVTQVVMRALGADSNIALRRAEIINCFQNENLN